VTAPPINISCYSWGAVTKTTLKGAVFPFPLKDGNFHTENMMNRQKDVERLAGFVTRVVYADLSEEVVAALKVRVLDSIGCALGALDAPLISMIKQHIDIFGGNPCSTLIAGGKTAPDRAAFFNGALVRYLDFNDSFLAKHETCHPSDTMSSILAASEYARCSGKEFLTALAVAYQVQCRLFLCQNL